MEKANSFGFLEKGLKAYQNEDFFGSYLYNQMAAFIGLSQGYENIQFLIQTKLELNQSCFNNDTKICEILYSYKELLHNNQIGGYQLGNLLFYGSKYLPSNYTQAYMFYQLTSFYKKGMIVEYIIPEQLLAESYMHEYGLGTEQNLTKAIEKCKTILNYHQLMNLDALIMGIITLIKLKLKQFLESMLKFV
eukprot:TRINITY_DN9332_c0_g1_i3.p2 TRINITY_DN9332_c0_g1~~TRINITY_DN9332_c0_g1_i3.p2  ORF type:complete len:191 (+),score=29.09 TRINITY_DN9332_c0_g1_i3:200-772(+)